MSSSSSFSARVLGACIRSLCLLRRRAAEPARHGVHHGRFNPPIAVDRLLRRWSILAALGLLIAPGALAQDSTSLKVGHWVRAKGSFVSGVDFSAESVEARDPQDEHELIGTVTELLIDPDELGVLVVMGQPIFVSDKTGLEGVDPSDLGSLVGARIEIEGHWRGEKKFSARDIKVRDKGRDRVEGRIDAIDRDGDELILEIMRWRVRIPASSQVECDKPLDQLGFAQAVTSSTPVAPVRLRDDDDEITGHVVAPNVWAGARLEWTRTTERDFNLDATDEEDRTDDAFAIRGEVIWAPSDRFYGLVGYTHDYRFREDDDDGSSRRDEGRINEAYAFVRDVFAPDLALQVGRQDFDEEREWLYDQNLDGVRAILRRPTWKLELAAATTLADGSEFAEDTNTYIAMLESRFSEDWTLGAYIVRRESDLGLEASPTHFGLRGFGEFFEDHESWAELSFLGGERGTTDLDAYAWDLGTTWEPRALGGWYVTAGFAFGSGDRDPLDSKDGTFRQTGLHDNNAKFGGVTSFKYYGELFNPELSNLSVLTLGIGRRIGKKNSVDLVLHQYSQDVLADRLIDTDIDRRPSGFDKDLGWEADLVIGSRSLERADIEVIFGRFDPGDAFPDADPAWLAKLQLRLKL